MVAAGSWGLAKLDKKRNKQNKLGLSSAKQSRVKFSCLKVIFRDDLKDDFKTTKLISTQLGTTQPQLVLFLYSQDFKDSYIGLLGGWKGG